MSCLLNYSKKQRSRSSQTSPEHWGSNSSRTRQSFGARVSTSRGQAARARIAQGDVAGSRGLGWKRPVEEPRDAAAARYSHLPWDKGGAQRGADRGPGSPPQGLDGRGLKILASFLKNLWWRAKQKTNPCHIVKENSTQR